MTKIRVFRVRVDFELTAEDEETAREIVLGMLKDTPLYMSLRDIKVGVVENGR